MSEGETLKTTQKLLDEDFPEGQNQGITAEKMRNFVVSAMSVGGADGTTPNSDGTPRGLIRLSARRFQVDVNGDGIYMFVGQGNSDINQEAEVTAKFIVNDIGTTSNYEARKTFKPGEKSNNGIIVVDLPAYDGWPGSGERLREGDIIELTFNTNGANLSNVDYYIFGVRLG